MEITFYDTLSATRAIIAAPVSERHTIYRDRLTEPLRACWTTSLQRFAPQMIDDEAMMMKMLWCPLETDHQGCWFFLVNPCLMAAPSEIAPR